MTDTPEFQALRLRQYAQTIELGELPGNTFGDKREWGEIASALRAYSILVSRGTVVHCRDCDDIHGLADCPGVFGLP